MAAGTGVGPVVVMCAGWSHVGDGISNVKMLTLWRQLIIFLVTVVVFLMVSMETVVLYREPAQPGSTSGSGEENILLGHK